MKTKVIRETVAVIGAGPVGLAAAAHLLERGLIPLIFEAGPSIASNFEAVRHVRLFSPWRFNIDAAARRLLERTGWTAPDLDVLPTAGDVIDRYLAPLAAHESIAPALRLNTRVRDIARDGFDKMKSSGRDDAPFVIRFDTPQGSGEAKAWAVLDATGNWTQPNPLGANGLPALGERALAERIAYGMPDILGRERSRYAGKRVLVAGAGHSAAGNLLGLAQLALEVPGTTLVWTIRGSNFKQVFGGGDNDGLPARGALGARLKGLAESGRLEIHPSFRTRALHERSGRIVVEGTGADGRAARIADIDEIIVAAGGRPDLSLTSELRVKLDPWVESTEALAPLIDPNVHSCGSVRPHGHRELAHPETRFYAVGAKSYGRAPNFLLATGYEQVRSVVAALAGDFAAADDVRLALPETGVCSSDFETDADNRIVTACCGGPAKELATACCVEDEASKLSGGDGCGCAAPNKTPDPVPARQKVKLPEIQVVAATSGCCGASR
jgi:hypothetical protein